MIKRKSHGKLYLLIWVLLTFTSVDYSASFFIQRVFSIWTGINQLLRQVSAGKALFGNKLLLTDGFPLF